MSKLNALAALGQAVWFDYIQRSLIEGGRLQKLINLGIRGVTSNPTIFEKAINENSDYDQLIMMMSDAEASVGQIYETLSFEDVGDAAELFLPLYESSEGADGYVSIEVSPKLAYDTSGTIEEGKRIFSLLNRPNIMIKVPATREGIPAIRELIGSGVNVNATLMFNEKHYRDVSEAYISGLETLRNHGGDLPNTASVASFFISRVDTAVDKALEQAGNLELQGKISIANAKNVYRIFQEVFSSSRWNELAWAGARVQRVLWASTGTKNPDYPDTLYVDELIGKHIVNTLPPSTLSFFIDHGVVKETITSGLPEADQQLLELRQLGICLEALTEKLQEEGVQSFVASYDNLLQAIAEKQKSIGI
ncbi:MAG: transaldolase [Acidobacteriota bacterium]